MQNALYKAINLHKKLKILCFIATSALSRGCAAVMLPTNIFTIQIIAHIKIWNEIEVRNVIVSLTEDVI